MRKAKAAKVKSATTKSPAMVAIPVLEVPQGTAIPSGEPDKESDTEKRTLYHSS